MSELPAEHRLTAVLELHQGRDDGQCSECGMSWPCTTFVTVAGLPRQTVGVARGMTGLRPMTDTLLGQIDRIATRHIDYEAFTAAADLLRARHPDSASLHLILTLVRDRSATLRETESST